MLRIKELINRYRHNRGFGVQSPYAFHFVTSVLKEKHAYYAYPAIKQMAKRSGISAAHCRRLFRIANYACPHSIAMLAPDGSAAYALTAARCNARATIVDSSHCSAALSTLRKHGCTVADSLEALFPAPATSWMLYVGHSTDYAAAVDQALAHATPESIIIVEKIHASREKSDWWQHIKQHPAVAVTFDLYSMGILFFDTRYKKQHYTLKM